jgi:hypothetical protein
VEQVPGKIQWFINRPINQDLYSVTAIRYMCKGQWPQDAWTEVLSPEGVWKVIPDYSIYEVTMVIPGRLVWAIAGGKPNPDDEVVKMLTKIAEAAVAAA